MSKIIIKKEGGKEVAYRQESFLGGTYEVRIGDLTESAGFFDTGKETRNFSGPKVRIEKQTSSEASAGNKKGSVNGQEGVFSIDKTLGYETEKYPSFKPDSNTDPSSNYQDRTYKKGSSSSSGSISHDYSFGGIIGKATGIVASIFGLGIAAYIGLIGIGLIIAVAEDCKRYTKPKYEWGLPRILLGSPTEILIDYKGPGNIYLFDKNKYPELYGKFDLDKNGRVSMAEFDNKSYFLYIISREYKQGDLEGIVEDFVERSK